MKRSKALLNAVKKRPFVGCSSLMSRVQSAGVRVSATMPERMTDTTIVTANCMNMAPVMPPMNPTGMNTAASTSTMAISAPDTCVIALSVASTTPTCSVAMIRSTFSMTMIASSTTMPMASTSPKRVRMLIENPRSAIPAKVPTIDTGTARSGMRVVRQLWRKMNTTSVTRSIASPRVWITSSMEAVMNGVVSYDTVYATPGGKLAASSSSRVRILSFTSSALAPARR